MGVSDVKRAGSPGPVARAATYPVAKAASEPAAQLAVACPGRVQIRDLRAARIKLLTARCVKASEDEQAASKVL